MNNIVYSGEGQFIWNPNLNKKDIIEEKYYFFMRRNNFLVF